MDAIERARRSLHGLSVGDAFGERFFGHPDVVPGLIAARALPAGPWRWTDDTHMALSVVEVLARHGRIEQDVLAAAFARRYREDNHRGYGPGAHDILDTIARGVPWREVTRAAFGGQGSMGNGAAMRAAPIGAYFAGDEARAADEARLSAEPTHWHAEGQAGAIAVAVAASVIAAGGDARAMLEAARAHTPAGATREAIARAAAMAAGASVEEMAAALGSGQRVIAVDTVPFALWCAARHVGDFEGAMWTTVAGLGDRDTTCAIVGGIIAAGDAPVPSDWSSAREPLPAV
jgi:ADP-ribosylglycohydrolase